MAPRIICLVNQKGGCGKSSCVFHLSGCFIEMGLRVQVIDADPQGSLSQAFFGPQYVEQLNVAETLATLFQLDCHPSTPVELTKFTRWDGLSIVCANHWLASHNRPQPETSGLLQFSLGRHLQEVNDCDLVLIDCPPNLYQCSWNALVASDYVVIPVPPEDFGAQGLAAVHQAIENAQTLNPKLRLLGHLVSRRDGRLLLHRSYEARLRELYGASVFETVIPEANAFKVALTCRTPVAFHEPASKASHLTLQLAREMLSRMQIHQCGEDSVAYGRNA